MTASNIYESNRSCLDRKNFQKEIGGKKTDLYILRNSQGMEVAVTNYGCAILSIMVPDKAGEYANVILGHDSIDHVINSPEPFLNTTIGRYGNRIAKGHFTLYGEEHQLAINNGPNSLHGGPTGFHTKVWDAVQPNPTTADRQATVTLRGSNVDPVSVTIRQVVNLTNHGFFNLSGIASPTPTVLNHSISINANFYVPIDEVSIPTGEILKVEGTPMDFRTPHTIGERIDEPFQQLINGAGYDHCYVLNKTEAGELSQAATYTDPASGRMMEVFTTENGIQLYTGNWLNGFTGAHGATYPARSAVCFEAQCFPDTPNKPHFPSAVLLPGDEYQQVTIYKFSVTEQ